ncbi:MAG: type I methionyl aminopeptidase [Clostridia bacterium]|nr:type I methionyl aminopeptidase [Clostridia bacterium]MDD4375946.1 type I methionyl aminopeptidase [Clostridia bacterium]
MIHIKSDREIEQMKESAEVMKKVLVAIEKEIKVGVTTSYLDYIAEKVMKENLAKPSFRGVSCPFPGGKAYTHATCISVNDEIIHGIPSSRVLKDGDVVSIDLGVYKNGFHADAGRTFIVGEGSSIAKKLVAVTEQAFFEGVSKAVVGNRIGDISNAIQSHVEKNGFSLIREYQGHGIGRELHEDPGVPNIGKKGRGERLQKGMALAIEPMVTEKSPEVYVDKDKWTVKSRDGKLTAYYENTIVITDGEPEILTL